MITVEDLLMAYASAYDAWLDPETERKNPTPEYAELIRQAVSFENAKLREKVEQWHRLTAGIELPEYPITEFKPKDLERENAKLREKVQRQADELTALRKAIEQRNGEWRPWKSQAERLVAENARLRELVSELWVSCPVHDSDCDECKHKGGRTGCELYDRMRELRVVDDG